MTPVLTEATSSHQQTPTADDEASLEQQMAHLDLSSDTRRFLRNLHHAEKQLNNAFNKAHQGGEREKCVSQVYRDLYGTGGAMRASR